VFPLKGICNNWNTDLADRKDIHGFFLSKFICVNLLHAFYLCSNSKKILIFNCAKTTTHTSLHMMQLEIEKLGTQLKESELQLAEFEKINFNKKFQTIEQGSLVETNKGYFLIAGSIGKITVDDKMVFVISNRSPLAVVFADKQQKDSLSFNGMEYTIMAIY